MADGESHQNRNNRGGLKHLAMQLAKVRAAADSEPKEGKSDCKEHGLETDYWCLDHSTVVCQHCLIFGAHRGDNAQTLEHRAYVGSCWDSLRKAKCEISAQKEALGCMELEEGAILMQKVKESLVQNQEEQLEGLGVQLDHMITEVDTALELLQDPVLNPLKLEQAMTNAAYLTKSSSLRWEAGKMVKDPRGVLVIYPPTLHLENCEGEALKKEQVYKVEDQSSKTLGENGFVEEEGEEKVTVDDDDADVVIEENNNEVETCGTPAYELSIVNSAASKERTAALKSHGYGVTNTTCVKFPRSSVGSPPTLLRESSEDGESELEQNQQELSRSSDLNLSLKAAPLIRCPPSQETLQQRVKGQSQSALPPPPPLDLQLAQLSTGGVVIQAGGTPSQFSLSMADPSYARKLESTLMGLKHPEVLESACQGQLVLVHDSSSWCRALVTQVEKNSVSLNNVDTGGTLSVVKAALYQVPSEVASLPGLSVSCCLAGIKSGHYWEETALEDWTRMVKGRTLFLRRVLDSEEGLVELALSEDGPSLASCLQFLGHVEIAPQVPEMVPSFPDQVIGEVGIASSDQHQPSPDFILLMFKDNPDLLKSLQELDGLQSIAANCASPPGWIVNGSALLAPYQGDFFRAVVTAISGTELTVLFVDYGNSDTASWWECRHLPSSLLFPPVFAAVRLPLLPVHSVWQQPQVAQELKHLLSQRPHCSVRELTNGFYSLVRDGGVRPRTVELEVGEVNVADQLVEQGFAEREQNARKDNQDPLAVQTPIRQTGNDQKLMHLQKQFNPLVNMELVDEKAASFEEGNLDRIVAPLDSMSSTSDDEDMTSMVDLRGWSPKTEVKEKSLDELKVKNEEEIGVGSRKVEVEVLSVDSPHCIWLREISVAWPHFNSLLQQQRSQIGKISEEEFSLGLMVLARISNVICRGELVKLDVGEEQNKLEVWLVDHGKLVVLDESEVGFLRAVELCAAPSFSFSVGVAEVEAAGTSNPVEWTEESTMALKDILEGKQVAMEAMDMDGAAVIWVGERICNDPFGVEQSHWKKVGDLLQQKGFAYPKGTAQFIRQKLNCPFESGEDEEVSYSNAEEADSSSKTGESDTESVALSLPEPDERKTMHLGSCFMGILVKVDEGGLVWVKETEQGQEIAVRLAGMKRVAGKDPSKLPQHLETNVKCRVVISGNGQKAHGPVIGDVFYNMSGRGGEGNLALVGLEQDLLEVVTTWKEWADAGGAEDGEGATPRGRSFQLAYPLPLALGLWLPVNISMVHPKLPMVFLSVRYVHPDTCFAQFRREIKKSLGITMDQVARMEASFSQARLEFSRQAKCGGMEKIPSVGDPVLALYENHEWCRGVVATATDTGATVDLMDYGHPASVEASKMRRLSKEMWKGPRQGRTVFYQQPQADEWQEFREKLEVLAEDCIFIRVEKISDNGDVTATFWSSSQDPLVPEVTALEKIC